MTALQQRVKYFIKKFGGVRICARALGIDAAYLTRLASGESYRPSVRILTKLGMKRTVIYEVINP